MSDFSTALDMVKHGHRVARSGWKMSGMFIFLVPGSVFTVNREPMLSVFGDCTNITYRPHIDFMGSDGTVVPWVATQTDIMANDWQIA